MIEWDSVITQYLRFWLSKDEENLIQMGVKGYEFVSKNFGWNQIITKLEQVYNEILKET